MAADYIKEIRQVQASGPYFIVGGCIGSSVAFEMARQLEGSGEQVALLAMIDGRYTSAIRWITGSLHNFRTSRYLRELPQQLWKRLRSAAKAFRRLPGRNKIPYLLRASSAVAEEIEATFHDQTHSYVPTKRQRFQFQYRRTIRRYRPGYYSGDLTLVLSNEFAEKPVVKEWKRVVGGSVEVEYIPGNHANMVKTCAFKVAALIKHFYRQASVQCPVGAESD
jgi:thioesterase domain-containing protein